MNKKIKENLHKLLWNVSFSYRGYYNQANAAKSFEVKAEEQMWASVYESTVKGSEWMKCGISPGRWAVGYNFLYVLYRVLDGIKPQNILELGAGQTTKMVNEYKKYNQNINHMVCEHDEDWKKELGNMFHQDVDFINVMPLETVDFMGAKVKRYSGFKNLCGGAKFDLILIDGPWGSEGYSRIDILDVLPECLSDSFVIIMDDCQREGEAATVSLMCKKLESSGIKYKFGMYPGSTEVRVITSWDKRFYATL